MSETRYPASFLTACSASSKLRVRSPHSLLLLDEPAAGMNPAESAKLTELIRGIRDRYHLTVLLIEHHMDVVMDISDRIYVLNYGGLIAEGTPSEIQQNDDVIRAYLGGDEDEA